MISSKCWTWALAAALAVAITLCGCGGGGGPTVDHNTGSISGHVADATEHVGLGGVQISAGGQSTYSDANGDFLLSGLHPGTYTLSVEPDASTGLVAPTNPPTATVYAGETTQLPNTIYLMDQNDQPPTPPV